MKKRWQWNARTRMVLTLELAIVLPAAVLIIVSVAHLKSIQRDRAVEGAIQSDFYQVLTISEKRMNEKALEMTDQIRHELPSPGDACEESLQKLLEQHPYAAHLFVYNPHRGVVFASRESRMNEPDFRAESEDL
ncbi:MAG TPA: sensor histidine kinase, partial [Terriglobia bacterium]|nr:sensor histidine kinase [Terriglobia bacterium]